MCHVAILNFSEKVTTFFLHDDEPGQQPDLIRVGMLRDNVLLEIGFIVAHGIQIISKNFALFRAKRPRHFLDAGMVVQYDTVLSLLSVRVRYRTVVYLAVA